MLAKQLRMAYMGGCVAPISTTRLFYTKTDNGKTSPTSSILYFSLDPRNIFGRLRLPNPDHGRNSVATAGTAPVREEQRDYE